MLLSEYNYEILLHPCVDGKIDTNPMLMGDKEEISDPLVEVLLEFTYRQRFV
jgi:hypothetical protein